MTGRSNRFGQLLSGGDNKTLEANRRLDALATDVRRDPELAAVFAANEGNALAGELREAARQRAKRRAALANVPLVDVQPQPQPALSGAAVLAGTPGSPGVAAGPARIVLDPSQFGRVLPGDILVVPYTNPSWTPLFVHAAAVVADTGSAMSHAAIVAREYGIPAVMGTGTGAKRLADREPIRVDGGQGLVFPADGSDADNDADHPMEKSTPAT